MQFEKSVCKSCSYVRSWNYDETLSVSKWFQFSLCFVQVHSFNVYSEDFSSRVEFPGIPVPESRESQLFFSFPGIKLHSREFPGIFPVCLFIYSPKFWPKYSNNLWRKFLKILKTSEVPVKILHSFDLQGQD